MGSVKVPFPVWKGPGPKPRGCEMIHVVLKQRGGRWSFRPVGCRGTEMGLVEALLLATKQIQECARTKEVYTLEVLPEGAKVGFYCQTLRQAVGAVRQLKARRRIK